MPVRLLPGIPDNRQVVDLRRAAPGLSRPVMEIGTLRGEHLLPDELLRHISLVHLQEIGFTVLEIDRQPSQVLHQPDVYHQHLEPPG